MFAKIGTFKYDKVPLIKRKLKDLYADIINSNQYGEIKKQVQDVSSTGIIIGIGIWLTFYQPYAFGKGIGIAVLIALVQYYTKWLFELKRRYSR